jgi:large subunit ribosomal protein L25
MLVLLENSMEVEIQITKRSTHSKGETKRLRREGKVPCVIYAQGKTPEHMSLSANDFAEVLRTMEAGFLPTTIFTLANEQGKKVRAIVKDIQYNVTNYEVIHLDFQELVANQPVVVKVPVECINQIDCAGVKAGGFLRFVMRHVKVQCNTPNVIPSFFQIDVKELGLNQFKRVSDLAIPKGVQPLGREDDIVVTVVKR